MKKISLVFLVFYFSFFTAYAQTQWKVQKAKITFSIKNAGITVNGSLDSLQADIKFDSVNYAKSSIIASVPSNTIYTDNKMRDNHLRKEEYFNVAKYPKISLASTIFTKEPGKQYKGYFKLTIKGVTKDVVIPFSYTESTSSAIFHGTFTINRRDYNIGSSSLTLSDNLTVDLTVAVSK